MTFNKLYNQLLLEANSINFSTIPGKLLNRREEFNNLNNFFLKLPSTVKIFSLAAEYAFEKYFLESYKKNCIVFNGQIVRKMDTQKIKREAMNFIWKSNKKGRVFFPVKKVKNKVNIDFNLKVDELIPLINKGQYFNEININGNWINSPTSNIGKFDIIDLDYVGPMTNTRSIHGRGTIKYAYDNLLNNGGILLVGLSFKHIGGGTQMGDLQKMQYKRDPNEIYSFTDIEKLKTFDPGGKIYQKDIDIKNKLSSWYQHDIGIDPTKIVYRNIYKGINAYMARIGYIK